MTFLSIEKITKEIKIILKEPTGKSGIEKYTI